MRLSPAMRVASSSFASRLLSAAMASRGDRTGGMSPSKCWIRGEGWPVRVVPTELGARELPERSMYVGRSIARMAKFATYCMGRRTVGQECMLRTGIKSDTGLRYEVLVMLCTVD